MANQRKNFIHKQIQIIWQIANAYDCVSVEELNMKAISPCLNFGKSVRDYNASLNIREEGKRLALA